MNLRPDLQMAVERAGLTDRCTTDPRVQQLVEVIDRGLDVLDGAHRAVGIDPATTTAVRRHVLDALVYGSPYVSAPELVSLDDPHARTGLVLDTDWRRALTLRALDATPPRTDAALADLLAQLPAPAVR